MSKLVLRWCLFCLLLTSGALLAVLTDWSVTPTPPIGGGSYNLDSFVYSWALMLLIGVAGMIGLVIALNIGDRPAFRRAGLFCRRDSSARDYLSLTWWELAIGPIGAGSGHIVSMPQPVIQSNMPKPASAPVMAAKRRNNR